MVSPINYPLCRAYQQLSPEDRLQVGDLVDDYELALESDPSITPEEICKNKPDLLEAFLELLNQLKSIDQSLAAAIPLSPPVKIGDYDVLEQVGMGGSGVVFRCREQRIDRDVAVKIFRPNLPPEEQKRRFLKETRITANFQDPGIPSRSFGRDQSLEWNTLLLDRDGICRWEKHSGSCANSQPEC